MFLSVLGFFTLDLFLVLVPCGQRKCLIWFQFSWTCWGLLCVLSCGLSLKMYTWKECVFSIFDSGVLKSSTIIMLLSIYFLKSSKIFFMYLGAPMLCVYICTMFMSCWWIFPLSIMRWPSGSLFMAFFFWSLFCLIWVLLPQLFFFLSVCLDNLFPALYFQSV